MEPTAGGSSRRRLVGGAGLGLGGLVAACSGPPSGGPRETATTASLAAPQGQLRWFNRGGTPVTEISSSFGPAFEARNPGVKVSMELQPGPQIEEKLRIAAAAGDPPDVSLVRASQYQAVIVQKILTNLDDYIKRDKQFKREDYFPIWLKGLQFKGQQYALPWDPSVLLLFYNRAAFDRAQVPRLDSSKVPLWEDLLEVARRLTIDQNGNTAAAGGYDSQAVRQIGFGLASYSFWMLPRQMGQEIYAPDLSRVTIAEPAARQALQWLIDVRAKYRVALPSPVVKTTQALSLAQGNLAMQWDGLFNVSGLRGGAMADDWDVVPQPQFRGKPRVTAGWASGNAVASGARNPDAAWHFVKFLAGPDVQASMMQDGNYQPMIKSMVGHPSYLHSTPPHSKDVPLKDVEFAAPPPFYPHSAEVQGMIEPALELGGQGGRVARGDARAAHAAAEPEGPGVPHPVRLLTRDRPRHRKRGPPSSA